MAKKVKRKIRKINGEYILPRQLSAPGKRQFFQVKQMGLAVVTLLSSFSVQHLHLAWRQGAKCHKCCRGGCISNQTSRMMERLEESSHRVPPPPIMSGQLLVFLYFQPFACTHLLLHTYCQYFFTRVISSRGHCQIYYVVKVRWWCIVKRNVTNWRDFQEKFRCFVTLKTLHLSPAVTSR